MLRLFRLVNRKIILNNPSNSYIEDFVSGIDRSKVLQAKHIMVNSRAMVNLKHGLKVAIKEMESNSISSVFVVDDHRKLEGIITIDDAIKALKEKTILKEALKQDYSSVDEETYVEDLIQMAVDTKYPIAVINENKKLMGIIMRVSVLSGLIQDNSE